jgi:hypothetical protein
VWVEGIRDSGWVLRTLPGDGYFGFGEDYDLAVIAAAEMCKHPDTRPDPTSPSAQDIWIAVSHLMPEVTA